MGLLYAHLPRRERTEHVAALVAAANAGGLALDGLLGCFESERPLGAMLCVHSPGRTIVAWPPRAADSLTEDAASAVRRELFAGMRRFAVERDARMVQALLTADEEDARRHVLSEGFFHLARLIYLRRATADLPRHSANPAIEYVPHTPALEPEFARVLEASYRGSLDCPELTGARAMEDVIASHRAQGVFESEYWLLAREKGGGDWLGCLLLAGLPEYEALEVAYVAVVPEARGRGLGLELVHKAIHAARQAGARTLTLAVDERNAPARATYARLGFTEWDRRDAFLWVRMPADRRWTSRGLYS